MITLKAGLGFTISITPLPRKILINSKCTLVVELTHSAKMYIFLRILYRSVKPL